MNDVTFVVEENISVVSVEGEDEGEQRAKEVLTDLSLVINNKRSSTPHNSVQNFEWR